MIIRLLLFFGFLSLMAWGALWLLRIYMRRWLHSFAPAPQRKALSEKLIQCPYCHTFIPQAKAFKQKMAIIVARNMPILRNRSEMDSQDAALQQGSV
jgi:hypothetical protein